MKRPSLNFVVDLLGFINLLCLAFTGYVMMYIMPHGSGGGQGRQFRGGTGGDHQQIKEFFSQTRHQWSDIHFYVAISFLILMLIHIILHWKWIKCYLKSKIIKQ